MFVSHSGSENALKSGEVKERIQESSFINRSLLALGTVVRKLSDGVGAAGAGGTGGHIPFRDSKLTYILQPSFTGKKDEHEEKRGKE